MRENLLIFRNIWEEQGYEAMELLVEEQKSPDIYMNELAALEEDFLVTFAMTGFSWCDLLERVRFNTLATMQIHILMGNLPHYDLFLRKEYGIQCFFITDSNALFSDWKTKYPLLPYMDRIPTLYMAEHLTEVEKMANYANLREMLLKIFAFIKKPVVL